MAAEVCSGLSRFPITGVIIRAWSYSTTPPEQAGVRKKQHDALEIERINRPRTPALVRTTRAVAPFRLQWYRTFAAHQFARSSTRQTG